MCVCVCSNILLKHYIVKQLRSLCSTASYGGGGEGCGGKGGGEVDCWRAVPFANWNEWYGAVVTIHACSFTSLSPLSDPHLRVLGAATQREREMGESEEENETED